MPRMKPNRLNVTDVSIRNSTIQNGCAIVTSTNRFAVNRMMAPTMIDFDAAAPT